VRPVDHPPHGLGVRQVGLHDRVAATRQPGPHLPGQPGRAAVVHRHPVTMLRERLGHRPTDAPGRPRHQDRSRHCPSSHRDSSLVAVAQFLAVAARPGGFFCCAGGLMIRNSVWASSLVP
jgi:hypothetical protein